MFPCQWGHSSGYICRWICFNIYLSIIYLIQCMARYLMMQTQVPPNITKLRNTKLHGARSNEIAFQSTDFCVPENLIFPKSVNFSIKCCFYGTLLQTGKLNPKLKLLKHHHCQQTHLHRFSPHLIMKSLHLPQSQRAALETQQIR